MIATTFSSLSLNSALGVKLELHDAVFYGFPYKLRENHVWLARSLPVVVKAYAVRHSI